MTAKEKRYIDSDAKLTLLADRARPILQAQIAPPFRCESFRKVFDPNRPTNYRSRLRAENCSKIYRIAVRFDTTSLLLLLSELRLRAVSPAFKTLLTMRAGNTNGDDFSPAGV